MIRLLFLCCAAVIVYGSLYPWQFSDRAVPSNPALALLHSWYLPPGAFGLRDIFVNILLYVPLGFLGSLLLPRQRSSVRLLVATALGFCLSSGIEMAQFFDRTRVPSAIDVLTNTLGTLFGAAVAISAPQLAQNRLHPLRKSWENKPDALLMLVIWLSFRLYPFFPRVWLSVVSAKIHIFVAGAAFSPVAVLSATLSWMIVGSLLAEAGVPFARRWLWLTLAVIPAQFFIVSLQPTLAELTGAVLGIVCFALLPPQVWRGRRFAILFLVLLGVRGLVPFRFSTTAHSFDWRPLAASLGSDWQQGIQILLTKCWYYGSAIWLLRRSGVTFLRATLTLTPVLALVECFQMWIPGRSSEVTDPLMAIALGFSLYALRLSTHAEKR